MKLPSLETLVALLLVPAMSPLAQGQTCPQLAGSELCVPLDGSFAEVAFGGNCGRNDDGSAQIALSRWEFDFYGAPWSEVYVNNNGNVSFGSPFGTFSSSGFPVNGFPMVAPFWGDVDTRADSGIDGVVWFRQWSTANGDSVNRLVVTWDSVGYFSAQTDKLNTFQVILTDGNDPIIGIGNNVCFCYADMQWTTGSASGGSGGFGGIPATVGANEGNGVNFFQIGRFDQPGDAYDGPDGNNDGIDYLDSQTICFNVGMSGGNVPPIFTGAQTSYSVIPGNTLAFDVDALGPESGQTVQIAIDDMNLANLNSSSTGGNPATASFSFSPDASQLGSYTVRLTATDDGTPPESTTLDITLDVISGGADFSAPVCELTDDSPARIDGTATDSGPNDTGVESVILDAATSSNVILWVEPFSAGADEVAFTIGRQDSALPGSGRVITTDVAGNSSTCDFELSQIGDCNGNGIADATDLAMFFSYDWNSNGVPDECEQIGRLYCSPQVHNSTSVPSFLLVTGSNSIAANNVQLTAYNLPQQSFGFFAASTTRDEVLPSVLTSTGFLCLGMPSGGFGMQVLSSGTSGQIALAIDLSSGIPYPSEPGGTLVVTPGTTLIFQAWYRDQAAVLGRNNLSDAVEVVFQ